MRTILAIAATMMATAALSAHAQSPSMSQGKRGVNPEPRPSQSIAVPVQRDAPAAAPPADIRAPARDDLFAVEDDAMIMVGGNPVPAGEVKRSVVADIARISGPPTTISSSPRSAKPPLLVDRSRPNVRDLKCLDRGPPVISAVSGPLIPGRRVAILGTCLGERPGRVEIIGQFPRGMLTPAFTAWDMTGVEIVVPADIRAATDHAVAVTVVAADGRKSAAMQARFLAARERVEVPASRWAPAASFELADTALEMQTGTSAANRANRARSGRLARSVRVDPECELDTMEVVALAGSVTAIRGWEDGQLNEASVTIDWRGACIDKRTRTDTDYVVYQISDFQLDSACRVALVTKAWAYCPAGVAP